MPPADRLGVLNAQDVAHHLVLSHKLSEEHIVRRVPQDMANTEHSFLPPRSLVSSKHRLIYLDTVIKSRGQWLLAHDVQSQRRQAFDNLAVHLVQDADKRRVHALRPALLARLDPRSPLLLPRHEVLPVAKLLPLLVLRVSILLFALKPRWLDQIPREHLPLVLDWFGNGGDDAGCVP